MVSNGSDGRVLGDAAVDSLCKLKRRFNNIAHNREAFNVLHASVC